MGRLKLLGELERTVMEQLWSAPEPQTVRQVHVALTARRPLAYTTIMTVLRRLADKDLVIQYCDDRAHHYAAMQRREELIAAVMVDALHDVGDPASREAALMQFVACVRSADAHALRRALRDVEARHLALASVAGPRRA